MLGLVGGVTLAAASVAPASPVFGVSLFFTVIKPLVPRVTAAQADGGIILTVTQTMALLHEVPGGTISENVIRQTSSALP